MIFAEWQQLGGPPGGQIRSILYDGEFVYAGGSGGVLVSNNQGELWSLRNEGLESGDTKSIVQLGEYIFVATDDNIYRTNNQGLLWEHKGNDLDLSLIHI